MAIHFRAHAKPVPGQPAKFYLVEKSLGHIDREELIRQMVNRTSLTHQEARAALDYLFEALPHFLKMGFTVSLGEMGYFRVTICSKGSDTLEEATGDKVTNLKLHFMCNEKFRKEVRNYPVIEFPG